MPRFLRSGTRNGIGFRCLVLFSSVELATASGIVLDAIIVGWNALLYHFTGREKVLCD